MRVNNDKNEFVMLIDVRNIHLTKRCTYNRMTCQNTCLRGKNVSVKQWEHEIHEAQFGQEPGA